MALDDMLYLTLWKGDLAIALSCQFTFNLKTQHDTAIFSRTEVTGVAKGTPQHGVPKIKVVPSHAEGRKLLHDAAATLQKQGYVAQLDHFCTLDDEELDLILKFGGSLTGPALGERKPAVFGVTRTPDSVLRPEEEHALRRLADAVGLTAAQPDGDTVLHVAVRCASLSLAAACLAAGVSPDAKGLGGNTARQLAGWLTSDRRQPMLDLFEQHAGKARPTIDTFCNAASRGDLAAVEACLAAGLDVNAKLGDGDHTPLECAIPSAAPDALAVIERLIQAGADLNPMPTPRSYESDEVVAIRRDQASGLLLRCAMGDGSRLGRLVDAGARMSEPNVLESLATLEHPSAVRQALLRELRRVGAFSAAIPLTTAVTMRDLDAVRAALAAGADPNASELSQPLLHLAAVHGGRLEGGRRTTLDVTMPASAELVALLLDAGADANAKGARDDDGGLPGFSSLTSTRADQAVAQQLELLESIPAATAHAAESRRILELLLAARKPATKKPAAAKPRAPAKPAKRTRKP